MDQVLFYGGWFRLECGFLDNKEEKELMAQTWSKKYRGRMPGREGDAGRECKLQRLRRSIVQATGRQVEEAGWENHVGRQNGR